MTTVPAETQRKGRRKWAVVACAAAAASAAWLYATAGPSPDGAARMFGLWQTRHLVAAALLAWMALVAGAAWISKRSVFRMLSASFALALGWALLEGIGAAGLIDYPARFGRGPGAELGVKAVPHLDTRGTTAPDLAARFGIAADPVAFHYRTDRRGFRNEPDRDGADIYLLGDSFLVAALVPFERTLARRLEHAVQRPVMNLSLIGLSVQAERDLLLAQNLELQGRLVLQFVFEGNDLRDSAAYRRSGHGKPTSHPGQRTLAYNLLLTLQRWTDRDHWMKRHAGYLDGELYSFLWTDIAFRGLADEIEHVLAALGQTRDAVEAAGGTYAVVHIPGKLRVLAPSCTWPQDSALADFPSHLGDLPLRLQRWCASETVAFLDLTDPLREATRRGRVPWFAHDTHWNPQGHEVAATTIASWPVVQRWAQEGDK